MTLKIKPTKEQLTKWGKEAQLRRISEISMELARIILTAPSGVDKKDLPKILERTQKLVISELDYRNSYITRQ